MRTTGAPGVTALKPRPTSSSLKTNPYAPKEDAKMRTAKRLALSLSAVLYTTMATADEPPKVPEGGLVHYRNEPCTDAVFGLSGTCYYSRDQQNNHYVAFYTTGELAMVIWQVIDGERVEIWRRQADI